MSAPETSRKSSGWILLLIIDKQCTRIHNNFIFSAVGIEAEDDKVDIVVSNLAGKSIEEIIAEGTNK